MNIVYVTSLTNNKWQGPNTSVPNQIKAQSKYDNVFWYDVNQMMIGKKTGNIRCHSTDEYPSLKITDLPQPFDNPDLVIFQGVYFPKYLKVSHNCRKKKIPYLIIPRSGLTLSGQKSRKIKKYIANVFLFNKFIKNAIAIEYLTEQEYEDSGNDWNRRHLIIPNGVEKKDVRKSEFNSEKMKGVFIGRLDIYQKGLDLFLKACYYQKDMLVENKVTITIYGPDVKNGSKEEVSNIINNYGLSEIIKVKEAIFDNKKREVLLKNDFFILTSRFEGHPMGLIEALSYGLPVLVSEGANMTTEIKETNSGWTTDTTVEGIGEALKLIILDKKCIQEKGNNAFELSKEYNWDRLAEKSHKEYKKILTK